MAVLRLLGRSWCHLCDDMLAAVQPLADAAGVSIDVIDVDSDPALEARWGELVPVLLTPEGEELCHYHLDTAAVRAYLARFPLESAD
ncbi:glutaredoxin family protein [Denitromonas iodatirespirans]|uniref:Glutaredoxin family protein n=1 Tax=Denitromonas iodatirespirans TaxID=2795389 RepID=A0A944D7J0_DENI1|nr:glutaredoxin family protein [Denitromonas iodatirespirans]MBT0961394.1 glutaredoxin family protein [Denitromonas iodatirespirans]